MKLQNARVALFVYFMKMSLEIDAKSKIVQMIGLLKAKHAESTSQTTCYRREICSHVGSSKRSRKNRMGPKSICWIKDSKPDNNNPASSQISC